MNIRELLAQRVQAAMAAVGISEEFSPHVAPSKKPGFGDYQANGAMAAAKAMKTNPRELATKIVAELELTDLAEKVEIAGPGFINIHLQPSFLAEQIQAALGNNTLAIEATDQPQTVVVDYSSPNLAKEMHVGHLRSTIIGDAMVRALELVGHKVIRQNHVGDWGTQFGMLLTELQRRESDDTDIELKDLEVFYQQAKKHFDEDPQFEATAREYVVKLQSGDQEVLALWEKFRATSLKHCDQIYGLLGVSLSADDVYGESAYNDDLPVLVNELVEQNLVVDDQGAKVAFLQELADKDGNPSPVIVQKKDGGYLYATTDLACLRYRAGSLNGDRLMYFIDARQSLHMQQIFTLGRKAGFVGQDVSLEHHGFGTMNGPDGKPFKTRAGGTVKLADLLTEAVDRAEALLEKRESDLSASERIEVARKVGIGAVKYADLSKTRTTDYIFSWDSMLSFEGNTAPYLQYAYTRVQSIFRKAGIAPESLAGSLTITEPQERALAVKLLQFPEILDQVLKDAFPHVLCSYLYELASSYMSFYEACPILKDGIETATRDSRLQLCYAVARQMQQGLGLLGIETMERM